MNAAQKLDSLGHPGYSSEFASLVLARVERTGESLSFAISAELWDMALARLGEPFNCTA